MEVIKVNGSVNRYTINLIYQIAPGNDPNALDKLFSSVGYGKIKISYGDWSSPTMIYKEEEALITNLSSSVDFASSKITYVLKCTSTAVGLYSLAVDWPARKKTKPSSVIKQILSNTKYGLYEVFPGMKNQTKNYINSLIASNDLAVDIYAKTKLDPLSYINYLVTCMVADTNNPGAVLLDSSYYLTLHDDAYNEKGGAYFTVKQVMSTSKTLSNEDVYEVDIGYPSDSLVMNFNVQTDNS